MTNYGPAQDPSRPAPPAPPPNFVQPPNSGQPANYGRPEGNGQPAQYRQPVEATPFPAQGYPPTARCRRCQRNLMPHAVACAYCGERVSTTGTSDAKPIVVATGRRRKAGYFVCGGGGAIALSVVLPWISVAGIASANLTGGGVAVLLALGAGLVYLGTRILKDRITRPTIVVLWVLAAVELLLVFGLFVAVGHADGESGGLAAPAAGFYVAVAGLIAATAGTIMVQTTRHRSEFLAPGGAPALSPDRSAWWDGQAWRDAARQAPPGYPRSPDGAFWWDGLVWRPLPPP